MGTKANPGPHDCYAKAEPDEPIFHLLARDRHGPALVWLWSALRELDGEKVDKVDDARACCKDMVAWAEARGRKPLGIGHVILAGILDLIRTANVVAGNAGGEATGEEYLRRLMAYTPFETAEQRATT